MRAWVQIWRTVDGGARDEGTGDVSRHLCGFERPGLRMLFEWMETPLQRAFRRSRFPQERHVGAHASDLFFRLFVTLFVLRTGTTVRECRWIFGWGKTRICCWVTVITPLIAGALATFREFPTPDEQELMAVEHLLAVYNKDATLPSQFTARLRYDDPNAVDFKGAIGAADGTFTVTPRWPDSVQRAMYTGYKKFHAYKVMVMNTLFSKAIIALTVGCPTISDPMSITRRLDVVAKLSPSALLLGDDAFIGMFHFITPYTTANVNLARATSVDIANRMASFNFDHSSNRMSAEHCNATLKQWAVIRGSNKFFMFHTEQAFLSAVDAVHALINADICQFVRSELFVKTRAPAE